MYMEKNMEEKHQKDTHKHCHTPNCECHHHEEECDIEDLVCDLDPNKICDNCMKCIDVFNTDEKGYVSIGIDGVDTSSGLTLQDLYKMYGLDEEDSDQ